MILSAGCKEWGTQEQDLRLMHIAWPQQCLQANNDTDARRSRREAARVLGRSKIPHWMPFVSLQQCLQEMSGTLAR